MAFSVEDLKDQDRFKLLLTIPYSNLILFVYEYLRKKSILTFLFWTLCALFLALSVYLRIKIAGNYPITQILIYSALGLIIFPLMCIPLHEFLHVIPYYLAGARDIRVGMDLRQFLFYVTAHRHVTSPFVFKAVAVTPFFLISISMIFLVFFSPGLWRWSFSLFLFVHATMCAGDMALLNLYYMNRDKKIYTWDDVEKKEAYFYVKFSPSQASAHHPLSQPDVF